MRREERRCCCLAVPTRMLGVFARGQRWCGEGPAWGRGGDAQGGDGAHERCGDLPRRTSLRPAPWSARYRTVSSPALHLSCRFWALKLPSNAEDPPHAGIPAAPSASHRSNEFCPASDPRTTPRPLQPMRAGTARLRRKPPVWCCRRAEEGGEEQEGQAKPPTRAPHPGLTMLKVREELQVLVAATLREILSPQLISSPHPKPSAEMAGVRATRVRTTGLFHGSFSPSSARLSDEKPATAIPHPLPRDTGKNWDYFTSTALLAMDTRPWGGSDLVPGHLKPQSGRRS